MTFDNFIKTEDEIIKFQEEMKTKETIDKQLSEAIKVLELRDDEADKLKQDPLKLVYHSSFFEF